MDIVERLRGLPIIVSENDRTGISRMGGALLSEAADEIERLREALDDMIQFVRKEYGSNDVRVQAAEAVLKGKE